MKFPRHSLSISLSCLLPAALWAQVMPLTTTTSSELGLEVSSYRYEETSNGAYFMSNEGNKIGILGNFSQTLSENWFWGAEARQAYGSVSYNSASSGSKGGNPDVITEIRITGGKDYVVGTQILAPYFGLGYRSLFNDLRGFSTSGAVGYRRLSEYYYLPLGVTHRLRVNAQARISTSVEYDLLLDGRQKSFLSDVNSTSNDPINAQRQGYGARFLVSYETYNWSVGGFLNYWSIADSEPSLRTLNGVPSSVIMEPQNSTREIGLLFKLRFN